MQATPENLTALRQLLQASFIQTDNSKRKEAESTLNSIQGQPGFSLVVLHLITLLSAAVAGVDVAIRQSASVLFKNLVKRRWHSDDEEEQPNLIVAGDRETIKTHLVELMVSAPPDVQRQLAEAVTIISKYDFPEKWGGLLPQLVGKLASQDLTVTKGVMLTTNSIMKRFRYVFKTEQLMGELKYCLDGFQEPLLVSFRTNFATICQAGSNKAGLEVAMETHRLMSRIYFSLNWQDIPEYFEDNIDEYCQTSLVKL